MDPRLICGGCGELGYLAIDTSNESTAYYVRCARDGVRCCQTHDCPSGERAIRAWEVLHAEPDEAA